jgi:hypothetical protein
MRSRPSASRFSLRALLVSGVVALWLPTGIVSAAAQGPADPSPASTPTASAAEVQSLRERAAAFWAARVAGDVTKQWELLEPRGKARMTPGEYAGPGGGAKYLAYQVDDTTVKGYFATVKVRLLVQPFLPSAPRQVDPTTAVVEDHWIRIRGTWYRSLEQG